MIVVVWLADGVWEAAVDAARRLAPANAEVVLLHVIPGDLEEVVHGAFAGLVGRRQHVPAEVEQSADDAENNLLAAAANRLGRASRSETRRGRIEREVVAAAADADLLVVSRDGDRSRLGPRSLRPDSRFVVDHAPCPVLLVWPADAPAAQTLPPPPPDPPAGQPPRRSHPRP